MSSGGGLIQLVAYGAQDVMLTGDPQVSLWKQKYSRHTNYALESIEQTIQGDVQYGSSVTFTLSRSGDMVTGLMAEVKIVRGNEAVDTFFPLETLFKSIELRIGGQKIDVLDSNWFRLYCQFYYNDTILTSYSDAGDFGNEVEGQERTLYLPFPFFFSSFDTGLALPLIALQYHDVEFRIELGSAALMQGIDTSTPPEVKIYADYVFLDSTERVWFAQKPHEYLMTQVQKQTQAISFSSTTLNRYNIALNFNHPVKMLTWCTTRPDAVGQFTALTGETDDNTAAPIYSAGIQLNGRERFTERPGKYFKNANPWLCQNGFYLSSGIYTYNFGINNSLRNKNSGTLNFSRVDNAVLFIKTKMANLPYPVVSGTSTTEEQTYQITSNISAVDVYAQNYNLFRVMSGMGGLAYAN